MSNSPAANIDRSSIEAFDRLQLQPPLGRDLPIELQHRRAEIDDRDDRARRGIQRPMLAAARRQAQQPLAANIAAEPAELIDLAQRIGKVLIAGRPREPLALGGHVVPGAAVVGSGHRGSFGLWFQSVARKKMSRVDADFVG